MSAYETPDQVKTLVYRYKPPQQMPADEWDKCVALVKIVFHAATVPGVVADSDELLNVIKHIVATAYRMGQASIDPQSLAGTDLLAQVFKENEQ